MELFYQTVVSKDELRRIKFPCKLTISCMKFSTLDESLHKVVRRTHKSLQGSPWQGSRRVGRIFHAQIGSCSFLCHPGPNWISINEDWGSTCNPRQARDLLRRMWLCPTLPRICRAELWQRALQELLVNHQERENVQCGGSLLSSPGWLFYSAFSCVLVVEQNLKRHGSLLRPLTCSSHTTSESHRVTLHWES